MYKNKLLVYHSKDLVKILRQKKVVAYPTEAVFALGCDPDSESAVQMLLKIKNRPWYKGLILVAAYYKQIAKYISNNNAIITFVQKKICSFQENPVTWIVPANPMTPQWLTGAHDSLAVRIIKFEPVRRLCADFGKPLISTSANLSGSPPARTIDTVIKQLGPTIPIFVKQVGGRRNPSEIRDALSGKLIRKG